MKNDKKDSFIWFAVGGAALIAVLTLISLLVGNSMIGTKELFGALFGDASDSVASLILFNVRLPRVLAAVLCGVALSVSGLLLQTSTDNALASPGIMGINAGAGLFVLISGVLFPFSAFSKQLMGFLGALFAMAVVFVICRKAGFSRSTLILTGVAVSSLFTSGSNAVITLIPEAVTDKAAFTLGGLAGTSFTSLVWAIPWVILGTVLIFVKAGSIELLVLGDEVAYGLGVRPNRIRAFSLVISAILAGAAVSLCGMLGFVGLIVPNLVRRLGVKSFNRGLILSALYGSSFLMACDLLARYVLFPYELPVGLILSLFGAPFFLYVLINRRSRKDKGGRTEETGTETVNDIPEFEPASITSILGRNGAGKSTELKKMIGILPNNKDIVIDEINVSSLSEKERARFIAYLPQNQKAADMTVKTLVSHGRFPFKSFPRKLNEEDRRLIDSAIETVGIGHLENRKVKEISGGEMKLAYLAMVLAQNTSVLLLDEPEANLDFEHQATFYGILRRLSDDGKTVILTSHDLLKSLNYSDRIFVMEKGKTVLSGTPDEIAARNDDLLKYTGTGVVLSENRDSLYKYILSGGHKG